MFPLGSYANGGGMRIAPLGIAFRNATPAELYVAASEAVRSTHVHPGMLAIVVGRCAFRSRMISCVGCALTEAVDGAFCIAAAVAAAATTTDPRVFDIPSLIRSTLLPACQSPRMQDRLHKTLSVLEQQPQMTDREAAAYISDESFQIAAVNAVPLVLLMCGRHTTRPADCIALTVALSGDTDTLACMAGGVMGALHGTAWLRASWLDQLENGPRGRDYAVALGKRLARLDCRQPLPRNRIASVLATDESAQAETVAVVCALRDAWLATHADSAAPTDAATTDAKLSSPVSAEKGPAAAAAAAAGAAADGVAGATDTATTDILPPALVALLRDEDEREAAVRCMHAPTYEKLCCSMYGVVRARFGRFLCGALLVRVLLQPLLSDRATSVDPAAFGKFLASYLDTDVQIQVKFKRRCVSEQKWRDVVAYALQPPVDDDTPPVYASVVMDYHEWCTMQHVRPTRD